MWRSKKVSHAKHKEPTKCSLVEEALRRADDFLTCQQVAALAGVTTHQAGSSLIHLRNRKAAESVESQGKLFWMATPQSDDRVRVVEERRPEEKPRKNNRRLYAVDIPLRSDGE